jgi:hypothetical protein
VQGAPSAAHPVTDRYVAKRLGEGAARAEQERGEEPIVGEPPTQAAFLFYLLLGVVIAALLMLVIFRTSEPPAAPPRAPFTAPR